MDIELTVIIPTRQRLNFLQRAISSVINQSVTGIELLVADNNSDELLNELVKAIVVQFETSTPQITFTYLKSDKANAAGVRNQSINLAKGNYLFFLDDDDEFLQDSIEKRLTAIKADPSIALLYCAAYSKIYPYPLLMYRYYEYQPWRHKDRLDIMSCTCIVINKQIITKNQLYFDELLPRRHDYDFCRRIVRAGLKIKSIGQPLVQINLHENERISSRPFAQQNVHKELKDKWGPAIDSSVYNYAGGILVWRKCFGIDIRSYNKLAEEFYNEFGVDLPLGVKVKLRLVSIHPFVFLALYHIALSLSQFYKNQMVFIKT